MMSNARWPRLPLLLLLAFAIIWILLAIAPSYRDDWLLENVLVFIAVPVLVLGWFRTPLSSASYALIFVFLVLHEIGSHYTYSEVPYDDWWASATGVSLNAALGWERNHYDRLLHALFGLLIAAPLRELLVRRAGLAGLWSYALPVIVVMASSTAYELIEWAAALVFGGDLGMAYLGTQGDIWDAHKDMACAALGAVASMLALGTINAARAGTGREPWFGAVPGRGSPAAGLSRG